MNIDLPPQPHITNSMYTKNTPEQGTNVGGATELHEAPIKNLRQAGGAASPTSSNDAGEGNHATHGDDTSTVNDVTPKTDVKAPTLVTPNEFAPELREWLSANLETFESALLHALIHNRALRDAVLSLPIEQQDISGMNNALVFLAFQKAALMERITGVEIPVPARPTFLEPHVNAAAIDLECGEPEITEAMKLIVDLQSHEHGFLHGIIRPLLGAWFGAKRGKRVARKFMMSKVPDVRGLTESLMADLDATCGLSFELQNREFDIDHEAVPPESTITLAGHVIGTPGNLLTIQGPVKSAKSTVLEGIMAAAMKYASLTCDSLGIAVARSDGLAMLHLDTEQSKHDHDRLLRRAYKRAMRQEKAGWLRSYHLTGLDPAACWTMLTMAVKTAVMAHGGIFMILIDGIADLCVDPNDAKECFELVRKLHKLAVEHECVIVCVIHENPGGSGGGKTRGHLGSQLDRKAETSLRLQKDTKTGVVEMWVERGRSCFIPKSAGVRFQWSDEAQMFVTLHASDADFAVTKMDKMTRLSREVDMLFAGEERLTYGMLVDKIMSSFKLAESTAKQRVSDYVALNLIKKNDDGGYQILRPDTAGSPPAHGVASL